MCASLGRQLVEQEHDRYACVTVDRFDRGIVNGCVQFSCLLMIWCLHDTAITKHRLGWYSEIYCNNS